MTTRRLIVEPRGLASGRLTLSVPLISVLLALIVGAIFLALTGNDPVGGLLQDGQRLVRLQPGL